MKQLFFTILTAGILSGLNSCCKKKTCVSDGADNIKEIELVSFKAAEVDSITLETFSDTSFKSRIDSSFLSAQPKATTDSSFIITMPKVFDSKINYKITLLSTKAVYKITDFIVDKEVCNTCNYQPVTDDYNVLEGYKINLVEKSGNVIRIKK